MTTPYRLKDGTEKTSETVLLRQSWKEDGKVHTHTVASLSKTLPAQVDALEAVLNHGAKACRADHGHGPDVSLGAGLSHGAVAAVARAMDQIGLAGLLGEPCRERDLVLGLVAARVCFPASKATQAAWWSDVTIGQDWGLAGRLRGVVVALPPMWARGQPGRPRARLPVHRLGLRGADREDVEDRVQNGLLVWVPGLVRQVTQKQKIDHVSGAVVAILRRVVRIGRSVNLLGYLVPQRE